MTDYLTKAEPVTGDIDIWAVPRSQYADKNDPPWHYELRAGSRCWTTGAVLVNTVPVTLTVPAGLNLVSKAIETLKKEKAEKYDSYLKEIADLDQQIEQLQMLTYQPEEEVEVYDAD
jgi:hypothetical protein